MPRLSPLFMLALILLCQGPLRAQTMGWIDGVFEPSYTVNCFTGSPEVLTQTLIGYYGADDASYPYVGAPYYVRVFMGTVGAPCTGGAQVSIELLFPLATEPVVGDPQRPIRCFSFPLSQPDQISEYTDGSCPVAPTFVGNSRWQYNPTPSFGAAWPVPTGQGLEIWFPVRSNTVLNGIGTGDNARFYGRIWNIDGVNSPESFPQQWVFVAPEPTSPAQHVFGSGFEAAAGPQAKFQAGDETIPTRAAASLFGGSPRARLVGAQP